LKLIGHFDVLSVLPTALATVDIVAENEMFFNVINDVLQCGHFVKKLSSVIAGDQRQIIVEPEPQSSLESSLRGMPDFAPVAVRSVFV
jgi:hypothetical protein